MGDKDLTEKRLESFNDVFSDIINVLVFEGERIINESQLEDSDTSSYYVKDKKVRSQIRDVSKYWKENNVIFSIFGLENQTDIDKDMVFRVMGYDGASYRYMLADDKQQRYPVATIVLNFSKTRWENYKSIYDCLDIDKRLKNVVKNYEISVFDIAYLSREQVNMFKSDFKYVADYFVQRRETGTYKPMDEKTNHTWELLMLISALTDDNRFIDTYFKEHRKEGLTMCDVLDKVEQNGFARGEVATTVNLIKNLIEKMNVSVDEAFSMLGVSPEMQIKCRPML